MLDSLVFFRSVSKKWKLSIERVISEKELIDIERQMLAQSRTFMEVSVTLTGSVLAQTQVCPMRSHEQEMVFCDFGMSQASSPLRKATEPDRRSERTNVHDVDVSTREVSGYAVAAVQK